MKKSIIALAVIIGMGAWSCSKEDSGNNGLKQSVENGVTAINHAVTKISATAGYQLITLNDAVSKTELAYTDTLSLAAVAGIYDYQPDTVFRMDHYCPYRLFERTGQSDNMVVNLPSQLIMHPRHLYLDQLKDTIYPNNFTITATDYHVYYNWWKGFDYKLTAGMTLDDADAGSMDVACIANSGHSSSYVSKYIFKDGYGISAAWQDGDTATSAFSLTKNSDTLFMEKNTFIWHNNHRTEKYYDLTIGSVELKKSAGVDSIQVFVGGSLQQHAAVVIDDENDSSGSVCHGRDILLTYDDGTTALLSDILAPVKDELFTLKESLKNMYFSKRIVDYIAFSIFYESHDYHN
jgi:hypothetical protein